jgi:lipooligosaccharide transport system ATP-binding protein
VAEYAGREALEIYGPPARLLEAERLAGEAGLATRRSGPAVAVLRAERANGALPEGERRAASLEDVFVLLTGAEVE